MCRLKRKESIRWLGNLRHSTELLNDPGRCVHIGDRESDIYELFCLAQQLSTHFLVRTCVDRLAGDGGHTVRDEMEQGPSFGITPCSGAEQARRVLDSSARNPLSPHGSPSSNR